MPNARAPFLLLNLLTQLPVLPLASARNVVMLPSKKREVKNLGRTSETLMMELANPTLQIEPTASNTELKRLAVWSPSDR
jgi:hypothetical protein